MNNRFIAEEARKYSNDGYESQLECDVYRLIEKTAKIDRLKNYEYNLSAFKPYGKTNKEFEKQFKKEVLPHLTQDGYSVTRYEKFYCGGTYSNVLYRISW